MYSKTSAFRGLNDTDAGTAKYFSESLDWVNLQGKPAAAARKALGLGTKVDDATPTSSPTTSAMLAVDKLEHAASPIASAVAVRSRARWDSDTGAASAP